MSIKGNAQFNGRSSFSASGVSRRPGIRENTSGKKHGFNLEDAGREFCRHFDTVFCAKRPWLRQRAGEFNGAILP